MQLVDLCAKSVCVAAGSNLLQRPVVYDGTAFLTQPDGTIRNRIMRLSSQYIAGKMIILLTVSAALGKLDAANSFRAFSLVLRHCALR